MRFPFPYELGPRHGMLSEHGIILEPASDPQARRCTEHTHATNSLNMTACYAPNLSCNSDTDACAVTADRATTTGLPQRPCPGLPTRARLHPYCDSMLKVTCYAGETGIRRFIGTRSCWLSVLCQRNDRHGCKGERHATAYSL